MVSKPFVKSFLCEPEVEAEFLADGQKVLRRFSEEMADTVWDKEVALRIAVAVAESREEADQGVEEFRQTCAQVAIDLRSLLNILEPALKDRLPWKATDMLAGGPDVVIDKITGAYIMGPTTRYTKYIVQALEDCWYTLAPAHRRSIRLSPYPLTIQFVDKDFITPNDLQTDDEPDPATADTPCLALHHTGCIYFGRQALGLIEELDIEMTCFDSVGDFPSLIGRELMHYLQWIQCRLETTPAADLAREVDDFAEEVSSCVLN